jgi:hypothetical protein
LEKTRRQSFQAWLGRGSGGKDILKFLYWTINQKKDSVLPRAGHIMALWRNFFANLPLALKSP